jgi:hypothetical protein
MVSDGVMVESRPSTNTTNSEEASEERVNASMDALIRWSAAMNEFFKHMTTLSSASIVGATAIAGAGVKIRSSDSLLGGPG